MKRQVSPVLYPFLVASLFALASCGQGNSGDSGAGAGSGAAGVPQEPTSFLLFPNPQQQPDGSLQTDSVAYAQAYSRAIDPNNDKDTLAKWKTANGFDSGTGTQVTAVFGDVRDLGIGRRMTARQNVDGSVAIVVENYLVSSGGAQYEFSRLSVDAAALQDPRWHYTTNAIEYSPGPGGGVSFVKFFNFDVATGRRDETVDLDRRGRKAMPSFEGFGCLTHMRLVVLDFLRLIQDYVIPMNFAKSFNITRKDTIGC